MSISLRWIEWGSDDYEQMLQLRDDVLRRPLGMILDRSKLQDEISCQLLTAWDGDKIVGTMILSDDRNGIARMRAVAVKQSSQGSGVGAMMVKEFERRAVELGFTQSFAHARVVALPFYFRLGYRAEGDAFEEVTIAHQKVRKLLEIS